MDGEGLAAQVDGAAVDAEGNVDLAFGGGTARAAEGGGDGQRASAAIGVGRRPLRDAGEGLAPREQGRPIGAVLSKLNIAVQLVVE